MKDFDFIYKIEIELDDEKIIAENKYEIADIYSAIRQMFAEEGIEEIKNDSHTLIFASSKDDDKEFAKFCVAQNALLESQWFISIVKRMTWFDTLYGMVSKEDILKCAKRHGVI